MVTAATKAGSRVAPGNSKVLQAVQEVAEKMAAEQSKVPNIWESSARPGLKFKVKKISRLALVEAMAKIPEPKPPVEFNTDKQVNEENPNHPDYQSAMRKWTTDISVLAINTRIVLGTELLECPPDLDAPSGEEWMEALSFIGLDVPPGKYAKYAAWVRWYALDEQELVQLQNTVERISGGTLEMDVQQAVDDFKSPEERDTDTGALPEETS